MGTGAELSVGAGGCSGAGVSSAAGAGAGCCFGAGAVSSFGAAGAGSAAGGAVLPVIASKPRGCFGVSSLGSLLWIGVPALDQKSLLQIWDLDADDGVPAPDRASPLWIRCLDSGRTVSAAGRLCWEGGTRSLSQDRGWEIFIGLGWHLSPPCKPICLRRRGPPGIATRDLHIQQHVPTPSYGTATHGPAPPPPPRPTRD